MVKDYAESILQAVEIVVGKCLNDVAFDKTEICTIVSDADKKNGRYTVTNGSARYDAFVNTSNSAEKAPEYKVNDSVRVSVPNGDYSQKKYIEGLNVVDNDTCPITYVSPLDTVLDMTDNIISGEKIHGLRANDRNQSEWCLWSADCNQSAYRKLQNNGLYDTIAIKGDFKTLLTGYNVNSGSYGLRLDMYFKPTNGTDKLIKHSAYLDSSDMYGNPYSFLIYSTQAVKFSIANIGTIQTISLYFYQKNNFTYLTDGGVQTPLPVLRAEDPDYSNLLLKNIYLSFGSDIINIDDNTVKLYTNEPLEYDRLADDESTNTKGIGLLWYNKNDAGQYLGFSDGIATPPAGKTYYDEIEYLQLSEKDSRLLAQQGKDVPLDESGLDLSADIVDAEKILNKLKTSITQDLYQMLYAFQSRIEGVVNDTDNNDLYVYFDALLNSSTGTISTTGKELEENTDKLIDYYLARLSNARAKMDEAEYTATNLEYVDPEQMMENPSGVVGSIEILLNTAYEVISNQYAGFMSIYDSFNTKLTKLKGYTQDYINEFLALMDGNYDKLTAYFGADYEYNLYATTVDETLYENRYCIYWYRYIPGYVDENERFMESGWKRLTQKKDFDRKSSSEEIVRNYGLPSATNVIDGVTYYEKRPDIGEDTITRVMDIQAPEEKYCVIIFYNHTMYKSEPLVFTNVNPPQDASASDQNGALYIDHSTNSRGTYQSYGINNCLINVADAYQTRTLIARYEGLLGGNEQLIDGQIFWYIPLNATMLTYDINEYGTNFSNDKYDTVDSPNKMEGHICFYRSIKSVETADKQLEFTYHIKDYYMPTSTNNEIICKVITKEGRELEATIPFTFSSYGTSGTDYTLVVSPASFQNAITDDAYEEKVEGEDTEIKYLDFDVSLFDYNNEEIELTYKSVKATGQTQGPALIGPSKVPYETIWLPEELSDDTPITGCRVWIPDRASGPDEGYYYGVMQVIAEFTIPEEKDDNGVVIQKERTINLSSMCTIPFTDRDSLYHGQVYIEGPSIIVYDSSGANPVYYKNPFKIYSNYLNQENDTSIVAKDAEITDVSWFIKYYTEKGEDIDIANLDEEEKHKYQLLANWMPKLTSDNKLTPSAMYLQRDEADLETANLYPVVLCMQGNVVLWAQPIYMMQNRYASAMLNQWDGSLQIDEENGTIMAPMVGAGRKTRDNTFEGVLMGDVGGTVNMDNATGIGLYGYHDGYQSFHFGIDGTAFIGKSGRGRILFNGNSGTIASASYYSTRADGSPTGDAGMLIDLDDGFIDIKGVKAEGSDYTGADAYKPDGYGAKIQLNAKADAELGIPYFRISTPNINLNNEWNDKNLIYIGLDDYYLQTENYVPMGENAFGADGTINQPGKGMRISLFHDINNDIEPYINAFNLKVLSKNLLLDSSSTATNYLVVKADSGNNLLCVGTEEYYLKTDLYNDDPEKGDLGGMKIDLMNNTIKAYNCFSLEAGTETDGGVMLNAQPGSGENYLFAGRTSVGYIKIDNNGNMSLMATIFTLKTNKGDGQDIYLSNTITSWTVNEVEKSNILLGIGTNFAVDNKGNLYANNATINNLTAVGGTFSGTISSSATISGGTIMGAIIKNGNGSFEVTADGHLTATSATIGGWKVDKDSLSSPSGTMKLSSGTGGISSTYFNSDANGVTSIEALEVKKSLTAIESCQVKIEGKMGINTDVPTTADLAVDGEIDCKADVTLSAWGKIKFGDGSDYITTSTGGELHIYTSYFYVNGDHVKIEGSIGIGGNPYADKPGSIRVAGDVFYIGNIHCGESGINDTGVDGTITYVSGGFFGGTKKKAKFVKGILVSADDIEAGESDEGNYTLPSLGAAGTVLTSDGSNAVWAYLKKKFNISLSGSVASGLYTRSNGVYCYTGQDSRAYNVYVRDSDGMPFVTTGSYGTGYTYKKTVYCTGSLTGGATRYTTASAGNITIEATKNGYEVSLEGGDTADNAIEIIISDATVEIK